MSRDASPFQRLGLTIGADLVTVERVFRERASREHPDRSLSPNAEEEMRALLGARAAARTWLSARREIHFDVFLERMNALTSGLNTIELMSQLAALINSDPESVVRISDIPARTD
jgi:hypothetical protein